VTRLDVEPVDVSALLEYTLVRMREQAAGALPVTSHGRLVGVLTLENVAEYLLVQEARQRRLNQA
jgi:CBS domain-containing protein